MKRSQPRFALSCVCLLSSLLLFPSRVSAVCSLYEDGPDCGCFVDGGSWDPSGDLLDVAHQTLGTRESCRRDGGKPFWQMQLGLNSAHLAAAAADDFFIKKFERSPWCSESVAYWHREARVPHPDGYYTWFHPSWRTNNTAALRIWYFTSGLFNGRGRWIESTELDLTNFTPGVNAPCPGAYQQLMGFDANRTKHFSGKPAPWTGTSNAHSQLVDRMTVFRLPNGTVIDFNMGLIEGNSSNKVNNANAYVSVPRYTPDGGNTPDDYLANDKGIKNRKIRGWGIDLDENGSTLCRNDRISWVTLNPKTEDRYGGMKPHAFVDQADLKAQRKTVEFARAVAEQGGPRVAINPALPSFRDLPTTKEPWTIARDTFVGEGVEIEIDYPLPLPYRVQSVEIRFAGPYLPDSVSASLKRANSGWSWLCPRRTQRASRVVSEGENTVVLGFRRAVASRRLSLRLGGNRDDAGSPEFLISGLFFHPYNDLEKEDAPDNE